MNLNLDWVMAMGIFVLLVGYSFVMYADIFRQSPNPISSSADTINDKVIDFLETNSYDMVVMFNISAPQTDAVLHLNLTWPERSKNSTQVYLGTSQGTNLTCNITEDTLYWKSNLTQGDNYFLVHFSNRSMDLNCTSSQVNTSATLNYTVGWTMEKRTLISQAKMDMLNSSHASYTAYSSFKDGNSISRDFRVVIYTPDGNVTYGPELPLASGVYARETWGLVEDTGEKVNVTVMVW